MTYEVRVRNLGTNDLSNLTLQDSLASSLGPAFQGILNPPTLVSSTASNDPNFNPGFNGSSDTGILDGTSGLLRAGEGFVIQYLSLIHI